jgi:arylsulfatase A-like enzyme
MKRSAFLAAMAAAAVRGQSQRPPNILFLLSDDQRDDLLSLAGHPVLRTPHIDAIGRNGTHFTNHFCATAICCTSRATILTGLHEKTHGISDFRTPLRPDTAALSYPALLRSAGYRTGFIGKYGVGGDAAPSKDFDVTYGPPGPEAPGQSRQFGRHAMDFLSKSSASQPFCLSVSFRAPHARDPDPKQYLFDPEEAELFRNQTMPQSPKTAPEYFDRLPAFVRDSESRARWKKRAYFRLIAGVDAVVGDILRTLTAKGLDGNTVVVYSSDNGYFLAERGLADKWYLYEESIRTPLLIHDPRLPGKLRGRRRSEMTLNLDLSPTFLSLAGLPVPPAVQGRDLTPLLRGERPRWRKDWFYSHLFGGNPPNVTIPRSEGVRSQRYKYIRWTDPSPNVEELYDLKRDSGELNNIAPADSKLRSSMEKRWRAWNAQLSQWRPDRPWTDPA